MADTQIFDHAWWHLGRLARAGGGCCEPSGVRRSRLAVLAATLFSCAAFGAAAAQAPDLLQPLLAESGQGAAQARVAATDAIDGAVEPYIVRTGRVRLSAELLTSTAPSSGLRQAGGEGLPGRRLGLRFFDDLRHEVVVNDASHLAADTLAVRGQAAEQPVASFTLTSDSQGYLLSFQDVAAARLYRVVGDTETGAGRVTEIDLTAVPPAFCGPPLTPPADQR